MNGLELSRGYFEAYGQPMLEEQFPDLLPLLAVGLVGSGSERFGYDDEISTDHDFEPGFCIFIPDESVLDRRKAFQLERAYAKLPKEYGGFVRQPLSPVGGNRNGVIRTADFYRAHVGSPDGLLSIGEWLRLPDTALAEATNGEIFFDNYGEYSRIRETLCLRPNDIRLKKLAGQLLVMAQAGQYNFPRCIRRGEPDAAQLACVTFVEAAMEVTFLLQERYMPYYKWSFRALRELPGTGTLVRQLSSLLYGDNRDEALARQKYDTIESVASSVIDLLQEDGLTEAICGDLEKHAYSVNDHITDGEIRNLHILAAVGN